MNVRSNVTGRNVEGVKYFIAIPCAGKERLELVDGFTRS